jgi:PhzF family phenazine biosynthesis protein
MELWTIAAFAKIATAGNLAGVVLVDEYPSDETMLSISSRLNYSETAFVKLIETQSIADKYEIRWFTPKYEVDLCGHATLAAAYLLWQKKYAKARVLILIQRPEY